MHAHQISEAMLWWDEKAIKAKLAKAGYIPEIEQVIRLNKALYGLKQSPREWQQVVIKLLKSLGFKALLSDSAVYYSEATGLYIVTYVDDCLIIGSNKAKINALKDRIHSVYAIEDWGAAAFFLGVKILKDRPNRTL